MVDLYKQVRAIAPKTHLITFSMGKYGYVSTIETTVSKATGIDWSNASVGFHTYGMNSTTGVESMQSGMRKFPMIMTEMGNELQIPPFEKAGVAFIGWGGSDRKYITWGGTDTPPIPIDPNVKPTVSFVSPAEYSEGTVAIAYPTVAESKNKVYALVGINEEGTGAGQGGLGKRHPYMKTAAVVGLDLTTGRRLWRTPISQPNHRFTQISYTDGVLGLYAAYTATTATGDSSTNFMGSRS